MSAVINDAIEVLSGKIDTSSLSGSAKFAIEGEGSILVDAAGVRASDDDADVTMSASADTFQAILEGDDSATAAFMSGRLTIDGDMSVAMAMASMI